MMPVYDFCVSDAATKVQSALCLKSYANTSVFLFYFEQKFGMPGIPPYQRTSCQSVKMNQGPYAPNFS